jgi:thiazole synthase ThiGH ThiG subunit
MNALLIFEQTVPVGAKRLVSAGSYAALLPGATAIGSGVAGCRDPERTIFISFQS